MVSASRSTPDIEVTAESLQADLSRLELQRRALERELAAVVAHLDTVQRALRALEVVMASPAAGTASGATTEATGEAARRRVTGPAQATPRPRAATERTYGRLTEQIMEYFARAGDADVRARDVAVALGRATDSGSINAVRSTLDRLVATSRVRRSGRGLYRAG
ncbi:hypothetical protein NC239_04660 [Streptomyces sp. G3]|uniref:hypothetical protein n=1 Tax=unclassified Streptomyces TaxID=2593676 RepID=UPI0013C683FE|nr:MULTISPECIES: hypothetical protein [unclassified Streptomyces]MCM1937501.1 hypothetical protein [Streptomyces sp. G3]NDZ72774.1 hypothetical protein [Streptomyces sp. SID10362]QUW89486.1 hypothetical protein KE639_00662 [Streptomyces sp. V17-9]WKX22667.1 hypothetical protein Q3Y68_33280 [Streptomyces sp. HUAS CX7]